MHFRFTRRRKLAMLTFLRHDFKASVAVFFVALPLCLGISLASGTPLQSGLIAGVVGGVVVPLISKSSLSVSGPAAGLTSICAVAISKLGTIELFFVAVALAGVLQSVVGMLRLGGFTHLIPSSVVKGMLTAIGITLILKQLPFLFGYSQDFGKEIVDGIIRWKSDSAVFLRPENKPSLGVLIVVAATFLVHKMWNPTVGKLLTFLPRTFGAVIVGSVVAHAVGVFVPALALRPEHFAFIPAVDLFRFSVPDLSQVLGNYELLKTAIIICLISSLETLLSIEAVDNLDPYHRLTPQNRELVAQGTANFASGVLGGIPITAVIVRSAANVEAGARSKLSSLLHGIWLLLTVAVGAFFVGHIPNGVLAVILIQTGYSLARPSTMSVMVRAGREQFVPFVITVLAILFTDLLVGVGIGIVFAIYYLIKHTYRAGFTFNTHREGHIQYFQIVLALNVTFLNKRRILETLEEIPQYSVVEIDGTHSVYIDTDVLGVFHSFKAKALSRHIALTMRGIPECVLDTQH